MKCRIVSGLLLLFAFVVVEAQDNAAVSFDGSATFPHPTLMGHHFWSSLLGGHYFGLRAIVPNSPIVGMMWFRQQHTTSNVPIRHWCSHEDQVDPFFWHYNDLDFGEQSIADGALRLKTSFMKVHNSSSLRARISAEDISAGPVTHPYSIVLYAATESNDDKIEALNLEAFKSQLEFRIHVQSQTAGNFAVTFRQVSGKSTERSFLTENSTLDNLKETVGKNLHADATKPFVLIQNADPAVHKHKNNFIAYQIVFESSGEFEIELHYDGEGQPKGDYHQELEARKRTFEHRFEEKFPLKKQNMSDEMVRFAQSVLSNTIGGVSYFHGTMSVDSPKNHTAKPYGPVQLLTAVPARTGFPRGFLWDEGFHQLLISSWDPVLSKNVIKSWFDLMNHDGWIPREIVLGDEAKARIPHDFLVQHSTSANPPAFFLAIESLIDRNEADKEWLTGLYPRLERWFNWFNTTQAGHLPTTFRWRGRNAQTTSELNPGTLESGLDDYPRASHPTDDEYHVDLRCWMALASRVMAKISKTLDSKEAAHFESYYHTLQDNKELERLHWSEEHHMFCDKGLHSDNITLVLVKNPNGGEHWERQVHVAPKPNQCVAHFGYVALFPFVMTLLDPTNPKLETIIKDIENPNLLWTNYGLRSIARNSFYYDRSNPGAPYWRSPIWINLNFLTLRALHHYSTVAGPYQTQAKTVYGHLRMALINNMFKEYQRNGYVFELYNDKTGTGSGNHPFTGWSSLIVRIMGENY